MKPEEKIIEGEISEKGKKPLKPESTELTVKPETNQPALIIGENSVEVATKVANALKDVVERQKLYATIQTKKYVMVEGWNTLGALMGVFPEVISVEKLPSKTVKLFQVEVTKSKKNYNTNTWENYTILTLVQPALFNPNDVKTKKIAEVDFEEIAYKATVMLKRAGDGQKVSQAEAFCSNLEESKYKNDEYAINSMAQTRATGKAFRIAFSWIMAMAGYEATPAEEIPRDGFENNAPTPPPANNRPAQEPTYHPVNEPPAPSAKPWQKWDKPATPNQARPAQPARPAQSSASNFFICSDCNEGVPDVVQQFSQRVYGKCLCRKCQPNHQRINNR